MDKLQLRLDQPEAALIRDALLVYIRDNPGTPRTSQARELAALVEYRMIRYWPAVEIVAGHTPARPPAGNSGVPDDEDSVGPPW